MEAVLHNPLQVLFFLIAPIAMILEKTFITLVRRRRSRRAQTSAPAASIKKAVPAGRYAHALEQQELDLLLEEQQDGFQLDPQRPVRRHTTIAFSRRH